MSQENHIEEGLAQALRMGIEPSRRRASQATLCSPLQKVRFVVSTGNVSRRLNRIWRPNMESVPVPVRSPLERPSAMTSRMRSKYCTVTLGYQGSKGGVP